MTDMIEAIKKRHSVRTYDETPIEKDKLEHLNNFIIANDKGPFGNRVRLVMIDMTEAESGELKQLGTYGTVKGPRIFITGAVNKNDQAILRGLRSMEDFGYCMEKAILEATALGLGTVWLGGFLNRGAFAKKIDVTEDELVPAAIPVGYTAEKRTITDRFLRTMSGGKSRRDFGDLFFDGNLNTPLTRSACGKYCEVLEAVRWAPSASNKQPWRIVMDNGGSVFHFFLKEDKAYNTRFTDIKFQNVDMGIAICHFELAACELGLEGSWKVLEPEMDGNGTEYIISWA